MFQYVMNEKTFENFVAFSIDEELIACVHSNITRNTFSKLFKDSVTF